MSILAFRLRLMNRALARPLSEIPAYRRPLYEHCRLLLAQRLISGSY